MEARKGQKSGGLGQWREPGLWGMQQGAGLAELLFLDLFPAPTRMSSWCASFPLPPLPSTDTGGRLGLMVNSHRNTKGALVVKPQVLLLASSTPRAAPWA